MDSNSWVSEFLIPWSQSLWIVPPHLTQYMPPGTNLFFTFISSISWRLVNFSFSNVTKIIPVTYWSWLLLAYLWELLDTFLSHSVFSDFTLIIWNGMLWGIYTIKIGKLYKLRLFLSLFQMIVTHLPEHYLPKHFYPDFLETTFFKKTFHFALLFKQIVTCSHLTICRSRPKITKLASGIFFSVFLLFKYSYSFNVNVFPLLLYIFQSWVFTCWHLKYHCRVFYASEIPTVTK